ncbi:nitronate monooxygenase [Bradyrhizobium sp. AZCC 1678]|uniref:NAD(P)H-dependent flavin oxidoreductase n=1 Tax=Bradyrhizobium sp. AZCC 1678 TaxID=3117030 RepID=UPI002FEE8AA6
MNGAEYADALPERITSRLRLPLIAAPMLHVSGPDMVAAACAAGVIGAFPTANARTSEELDGWLAKITNAGAKAKADNHGKPVAPFCPNLIMRQPRLADDLACVIKYRSEIVITSVGSPAAVIPPLHDAGSLVFADVGTLRHAEGALEAGADGLILLTAGAGGQTGWLNPFAFVRAVSQIFSGPIVLAGGISDGFALWASRVLGCRLAYMGTRFIATRESMAADEHKQMLVDSSIDDVTLTNAFTGLQTNILLPSIINAGLDPGKLNEQITVLEAAEMYGGKTSTLGPKRWRDIWSAGHSVSGVDRVTTVAELVNEVFIEYCQARDATRVN